MKIRSRKQWRCVLVTALLLIKFRIIWVNQLRREYARGRRKPLCQATWIMAAVPFRWRSARGGIPQVTLFVHPLTLTPAKFCLLGSGPELGIVRGMFADTWVGLWLNVGAHCNVLAAGRLANLMTPVSIFSLSSTFLNVTAESLFFCGHQPADDPIPRYLFNEPPLKDWH